MYLTYDISPRYMMISYIRLSVFLFVMGLAISNAKTSDHC